MEESACSLRLRALFPVWARWLSVGLAVVGALVCLASPAAGNAASCWDPDPAFAIPECVDTAGDGQACAAAPIRLWSDRLKPVDSGQLPDFRDSTRYSGTTHPGTGNGDELFTGIDIVGDKAYVAYVNGWSIWDLSCGNLGTANCPTRLTTREILPPHNHFPHDTAGGEIYLLIYGIDAHLDPTGTPFVAMGGEDIQSA